MKGEWVLFRLKGKPGEKRENWMLQEGRPTSMPSETGDALVEQCLTSVTTGRTMAEIAAGAGRVALAIKRRQERRPREEESRAPRRPPFQPPQLATLVDAVPPGRLAARDTNMTATAAARHRRRRGDGLHPQRARLDRQVPRARQGRVGAARRLPDRRRSGRARQERQARLPACCRRRSRAATPTSPSTPSTCSVDQGEDITELPNIERKERLAALLRPSPAPILYADHIIGKGEELFEAMCKEGGEGIISKKADAPYRGARTQELAQGQMHQRQEFVIVGWQASDKRRGFRSLLLAVHEGGKLSYAGKVGTGFDAALIEEPERDAGAARQSTSRRSTCPAPARAASHWLEPKLVAEVAFTEFTADGVLRHPSFLALREDKQASEVVPKCRRSCRKPQKQGRAADRRQLRRQDQQPRPGDLPRRRADQGRARRLLSRGRGADAGRRRQPADQPGPLPAGPRPRNASSRSTTAGTFGRRTSTMSRSRRRTATTEDYLYVDDAAGILACVQMGTIEFHGWGSQVEPLEKPDRLVFDLDPDVGLDFDEVKEAAERLRDLLADIGLATFPMLTGGKGIHVVVPLDADGRLARGQGSSPSASPRASPRPSPSGSPPTSARPSARAASSSTICATSAARPRSCLIRPAPAKARRSRRRSPGRSWTSSRSGAASPSATPTCCSSARDRSCSPAGARPSRSCRRPRPASGKADQRRGQPVAAPVALDRALEVGLDAHRDHPLAKAAARRFGRLARRADLAPGQGRSSRRRSPSRARSGPRRCTRRHI